MFDFSPLQIMIVLAIALLVFGPKRLPEMGRNLGQGLRDFKGGLTGDTPTAQAPAPAVAPAQVAAVAPAPPLAAEEAVAVPVAVPGGDTAA